MGKRARPSRGLPSRRFRRRFPEQKLFRVASVRESIRSECPVLRPCTPPAFPRPDPAIDACRLRNFSSTPTLCRRCYGGTRLSCDDLGPHLPHGIAETNAKNGLI